MNLDSLDILLVGLGKVGMTYDLKGPSSQVLTHARAISSWSKNTNATVNVVGVDPDGGTQKPFDEIFNSSEWFPNIDLIDSKRSFDLAIIATPIATIAYDTFKACKNLNIKKVVIEKPAATSIIDLESLISLPESETNFIVGFPRPLLPSSNYLRDQISSFGKDEIWKVDIYYGGSVLNILSHFLNLVEFLIEPFVLESFGFTSEDYLNARFKSNTGRVLIRTHQYSEQNDEENRIFIEGPISISYTKSGRDIRIGDSNDELNAPLLRMDFQREVSQMIGNFGNKYLNWASLGEENYFTHLTSSSLVETIRLAEALNVK